MSLLENASRATTGPWYTRSSEPGLSEERQPSPAGPLTDENPPKLHSVPQIGAGRTLQTIRIGTDIGGTFFKGHREAGQVFSMNTRFDPNPVVVVSHPDHIKSL